LGHERTDPAPGGSGGQAKVQLLYFAWLAKFLLKDHEAMALPESVKDVQSLLAYLRTRYRGRAKYLRDEDVRVTVNKQFAEPFTRVEDGDEIALVPASPTPPAGV
jgi:molybdopterin converting factor small subunit